MTSARRSGWHPSPARHGATTRALHGAHASGRRGHLRRAALALAGLAALAFAGACVESPGGLDVDHAPVARVIVPQLWPASEPVTADGSLSDDIDGDALQFRVDWGDGTPEAQDDDGIAQHTFEAPGTYSLALTVEDPDGVPAAVQAQVVLVGDDGSGCSCELGCFDDAVCTQRGCLLFRSSNADEEAPPAAFADALECR